MATGAKNSVRIELLGGFEVLVAGEEVGADVWPTRRAAELVKFLALADGHRVSRDTVIDALWPRLDGVAGAANLRKAAHHARKALGAADAVVLRGGLVSLFPDHVVETDVERFDKLAQRAFADGSDETSVAASSAYTGDLLPDDLYEDWTHMERNRLRARHVELLRLSAQWECLVEAEPTDEQAYRELMRRDLDRGLRPSAIRWYGRLRTVLRHELGALPDAETEAIYDKCVTGLGVDESTCIGRQVELARASALLRSNVSGGVLVVRGPGGIGKSTLTREVARAARADGWVVISVTASEAAGPYAPLVNAVEQLIARDASLLDAIGDRGRSVLAALTPLAASSPTPHRPLTRHEVIGVLRRLLLAAGGSAPAALVVDDAHLADEATIDLLSHLGSAGGRRIIVVLVYRPEAARQMLTDVVSRLARARRTVEVDLEPLDRQDMAVLVSAGALTPRSPDVVARIVELAEGNPFLALELARNPMAGVSALVTSARQAVISKFVDSGEESMQMVVMLAVAGDDLDPATVVALTGASETAAFSMLDRALSTGVLIVSGGRYRFRHELLRRALLDALPPHQRLTAHRLIAQRLTDTGAQPEAIAGHWVAGGRPDDAREPYLSAARQAMKLGAHSDALVHLGKVLDHSADDVAALGLRAEALDALGRAEAPAAYGAAADAVGGSAAHDLRAKQALAQIKLGDPRGGLRVLEGVEPTSVEGRLAHALALCGAAALGFGDPGVGAAKAAEARRLALESNDSASLVIASWAHAAAAHARGDLRSSVQADLSETFALPSLAVNVFDGQLCITQRLLYGARPYADVIAFADSFEAEATRLGAARGRAFAVTIRGEAKLLSGRLDDADEDLALGTQLHHDIGAATGEAFGLQRRAEVAFHRGRHADGVALLDEALAIARESDVGFHLLDRIYGTRVSAAPDPAAALSAVEEAEEAVRGTVETCPGCRITLAVPAAIASARAGDEERADRWEAATEYLANVVMRLPAWDAALKEVRGHRARARGDGAEASEHFRTAAAGFRTAGQPLDDDRCTRLATDTCD